MNSVALSPSAGASALSAEADLVRLAARGDAESFDELYRRHGPAAWRLAQAAAVDRDAAVWAVGEGFVRGLRGARRGQTVPDEDGGFRPLVLAAVYRSATEHARATGHSEPARATGHSEHARATGHSEHARATGHSEHARATGHSAVAAAPMTVPAESSTKARRGGAKAADAALVERAFRSLPERWRAAVWLSAVESMPPERAAPILGVSIPVATQLVNRGTRGLTGRFTQAHRAVPQHLGTALRPLALTVPATLADVTAEQWALAQHERGKPLAPVTTWLSERAVRPLWVAVGSLMGLGLIGLGLAGEGSSVANGPVAAGRAVPGAGVGVNSSAGPFTLPGQLDPAAPGTGVLASFAGSPIGAGADNSMTPAFLAGGLTAALGTGGGAGTTGGAGSGGTAPAGGAAAGGTAPAPSPSPTAGTPASGQQTVLSVPGVAAVTNSGGPSGTTSVNVLPSGGGGVATVTLGCSTGVGVSVGGTQLGCTTKTTPAPTTTVPRPTSTTSTTTLLGGLLGSVPTTLPKL